MSPLIDNNNLQFQGHLYVHDLIMDENTYTIADLLPDGEFQSKTLVYTKYEGKEHLLVEVTMGVHIKPKGIFERFWCKPLV